MPSQKHAKNTKAFTLVPLVDQQPSWPKSPSKVEVVDFEELGMEAIRKIEVKNFPAFIICDDKGGNLFEKMDK